MPDADFIKARRLEAAQRYVEDGIRSFDSDPADSDAQRACLATLQDVQRMIGRPLGAGPVNAG